MTRKYDNYVSYHTHSDYSLLDSTTDFKMYIQKAVELGQKAICFTEHGNTRGWVAKKLACDAAGIKYLHGIEMYLTEELEPKVRDNYHTILIAKNYQGFLELNRLISMSTDDVHKYYVGRISFGEFTKISQNIIKISACLASPLNKIDILNPWYDKLARHYDYFEIQPHNCEDQVNYNRHLAALAQKYGKPLIAGTDAHNVNAYFGECRSLLCAAKHKTYGDEDNFDLTYKSREELERFFATQDAIPEDLWQSAIDNTVEMADSVEEFELDTSLKYPILYGTAEKDREMFIQNIKTRLEQKLEAGIIPREQEKAFRDDLNEELRVFTKLGMCGFMQSMSEITTWCHENGIVTGPGRGSVGGSRAAYVTDIIDLNPETWETVFSRFANASRREVGDIDIDVIEEDRPRIFNYIINRFGQKHTAFVPSAGTLKDRGCIDEIVRGLRHRWMTAHQDDPAVQEYERRAKEDKKNFKKVSPETAAMDPNPYKLSFADKIKVEYDHNSDACRKRYKEIFYYFDGMIDTRVSQSVHPAGIVISPITLDDNYGTFVKDGQVILQIDMEEIHEVSLVKYDLLALKTLKIIKDACWFAGIPYPKSYEIDWDDQCVWEDMLRSPVGIFQMEGDYSHKLLRDFEPHSIKDMSLVTACIRPSGASYRNELIAKRPHKNPSPMIDELLKDNFGFLVYQCDVLKFLQQICGLSGSESDNIRRAIGRKDRERLEASLPEILEGYCSKSDKPRDVAEQEAKEFLQILEDSASYMFGYNHSISYCLIGFLCAWLRYYHPHEFITAYLNNAANEDDIKAGTELAEVYGIKITAPRFGVSLSDYMFDREKQVISKGISSVKYMNKKAPMELYNIYHTYHPKTFMEVLRLVDANSSCDDRQISNLIRLDFFFEYGNIRELQRIYALYKYFKRGAAKTISKEKLKDGPLKDIIVSHSRDTNAKGVTLKRYTIEDMDGILEECESYVKSLNLPDADLKSKINDQLDLMGYVAIATNREEDRRKLYVMDTYNLKSGGQVWGVAINVRSIGTGKQTRLTVKRNLFDKKPFSKKSILYADQLYKNQKGYWYLNWYEVIA